MRRIYDLGEGELVPGQGHTHGVAFEPHNPSAQFHFWDGAGYHIHGTGVSAKAALAWTNHLRVAGALWLEPYIARLAAGEVVAPAEIVDAYRKIHGKDPRCVQD